MAQYQAVRERVGLLDRESVALIGVRGPDRYTWLQGMISNDTRLLANGKTRRLPACILNATGHLLTDVVLLTSEAEPDLVLLELPGSERDKTLALLDRLLIMEEVELSTQEVSALSLQGPMAATVAESLVQQASMTASVRDAVALYAAEHTGSGGYDFYVPTAAKAKITEAIRQQGILEIGAEAQEILRVEAGIPKYGADMDESVIALEAGLGPTHISFTKGCYVGQEIIARIDSRGHTNRALTGMVVLGGPTPSSGAKLYPRPAEEEAASREIGRITSVIAAAPAAGNRTIALGYVRHEYGTPGSRLIAGEAGVQVETVELPFYHKTL